MDKILLTGLSFQGCHGVLPEEKTQPQSFIFDLELSLDLQAAGRSDDLQHTVSYAEVYATVQKIFTSRSFNLLEALAEEIALECLAIYPLESIQVSVYKPQAPVQGRFEHFGVRIIRDKKRK